MAKVKLLQDGEHGTIYKFICPGCGKQHWFWTKSKFGPVWSFNGDMDKPTVRASIKVTTRLPDGGHICHSFVTDGRIQFLEDSTHHLKGQTVDLPDID